VAEYLRGGAETGATQQAKVLDRLTRGDEAPAAVAAPVVQVTNVESLSNQKLEQLTRHEEPAEVASAPQPEKERQADLNKANEKLSSLLNKPK
jgi:uncharacterized protein YciW